jgi:hypothetical protein
VRSAVGQARGERIRGAPGTPPSRPLATAAAPKPRIARETCTAMARTSWGRQGGSPAGEHSQRAVSDEVAVSRGSDEGERGHHARQCTCVTPQWMPNSGRDGRAPRLAAFFAALPAAPGESGDRAPAVTRGRRPTPNAMHHPRRRLEPRRPPRGLRYLRGRGTSGREAL